MAQSLICLGSYHVGHVGIAMAEQIIRDRPVLHTADIQRHSPLPAESEQKRQALAMLQRNARANDCAFRIILVLHGAEQYSKSIHIAMSQYWRGQSVLYFIVAAR